MELADFDTLAKVFGQGPYTASKFMDQQDLARQFQDQKLQKDILSNEASTLANQFTRDANPLRLQGMGYDNESKRISNEDAGITLQRNRELAPIRTEAERVKLITEKSDNDLKQMFNTGQRMALSDDPVEAQRGQSILEKHKDFIKIRTEHKLRMDEQKDQQKFTSGENALNRAHQTALEGMRQEGQTARKGMGKGSEQSANIVQQVMAGKIKLKEMPTAFTLAAQMSTDPEEKAFLLSEAAKAEALLKQLPAANQTGKLDIGAQTGLPTRTQDNIFGTPPAAAAPPQLPPGARQIGTSGGKPVYVLPDGRKFMAQ